MTARLADALRQARSLKGLRVVCDKKGTPLTQKEVQVIMRRVGRDARREVYAPLLYEQHADDSADPVHGEDRDDAAFRVRRAVATLPAGQREAVHHLVLQEESLAVAAQQTGRSEGALKVNLHRAIKALRAKFERDSV